MENSPLVILPPSPAPVASEAKVPPRKTGATSFQEVLNREIGRGQGVKFSAHAEKRLRERNIVLAGEDIEKINMAVRQAESRGARESLIVYGDLALIASVRNKTIVTALEGKAAEGHVFTNIDSAVILGRRA